MILHSKALAVGAMEGIGMYVGGHGDLLSDDGVIGLKPSDDGRLDIMCRLFKKAKNAVVVGKEHGHLLASHG